ncbi:MAG: hypothetical protein JO127_06405 [Caulobacteraceae bacterium]|nr:hypothetical protein [Caulobacteraceae bacterium]
MREINVVGGRISPDQLGRTMMHEHLVVGLPGWELDVAHPGPTFRDALAVCVDRISELKDAGVRSFVDPCPTDLGRDAKLAGEVAARTGMQIVLATGLFCELHAGGAYWRAKVAAAAAAGQDAAPYIAELFVKEIEEGIGDSGVRAGIIKVATDVGQVTPYERAIFKAAAIASQATGVPITTHTQQGELGLEQQAILTGHGVPACQLVIGHSDGSPDHHYHLGVIDGGSYLGFDRWGYQTGRYGRPDEDKIASLMQIVRARDARQVVVACDHVCCYRGSAWPPVDSVKDDESYNILHFVRNIAPRLKAAGLSQADLDLLTIENPRRYFSASAPGAQENANEGAAAEA